MLTSMAAVPASTSRSPQLRVTIYSPNQSSPEPRIPGHAARAGQPPPLSRHTAPRASEATSRRPSASAPGAKCPPALRIATKAEAHSTTVTAAAVGSRAISMPAIRNPGTPRSFTQQGPGSGVTFYVLLDAGSDDG
jgi:hypothetical protein